MFKTALRASLALALVCQSVVTGFAQTSIPKSPPSELDAFMEKVLARRKVNRQTLEQYILDDVELIRITGPGRVPLFTRKEEYVWFLRDGLHIRSPSKIDGVTVGESDRVKYEEDWIRREKERLEREAKKEAEKSAKEAPAEVRGDESVVRSDTPVPTPRFVSEAYFMDFKFEPGNYYLAGREQLEGKNVLRIEYYPTRMFNDDDRDERDEKSGEKREERKPRNAREEKRDQDIERQLNKTALITLWVDPTEYQIVKYTFDNVWMDFLPGRWLVQVDDVRASMSMGQPFPGVWLPREINVQVGFTTAPGAIDASYDREFKNYKLGEVTSKVRIPKNPEAPRIPDAPLDPNEIEQGHGPFVQEQAPGEIVREVRVHGNAILADEEVLRLAGVSVGTALPADGVDGITQRLKQSGRFESVEVRKRYRSLTDETDVAIVLVVHERPGVVNVEGGPSEVPGPFARFRHRLMFLPMLSYEDGYGFTYGGRVSTKDLLGVGEQLSVPATWGGTRRIAFEFAREFDRGPLTHIESSIGIQQRENPRFDIDDQRVVWDARAERSFARVVRAAVETSHSTIEFGDADDGLWTLTTQAIVDTRLDPKFPRNAVYASVDWTGLNFDTIEPRINRYTTDLRGYLGVVGQLVAAGRVEYTTADRTLPDYERLLLGGADSLRGFRAGAFDGDRRLNTSAELRLPFTSVMSVAKLGVIGFFDAAKVYDAGTSADDAAWHKGVGGGVFLIAPFITLNLDVAHGLKDGDTRVHFSTGFSF